MKQYELDIKNAELNCDIAKRVARRNFVQRNARAMIDDIVTDGYCTIKIEALDFYNITCDPTIIYRGKMLTKKLEPFKNGDTGTVIQSDKNFKIIQGGK